MRRQKSGETAAASNLHRLQAYIADSAKTQEAPLPSVIKRVRKLLFCKTASQLLVAAYCRREAHIVMSLEDIFANISRETGRIWTKLGTGMGDSGGSTHLYLGWLMGWRRMC